MTPSFDSSFSYKRLPTREVKIGDLYLGYGHPIRMQTMTTLDTMDTKGIVEQTIRCVEKGAELVRITAPSIKEAENLYHIKKELRERGYHVPLVADIHFTPNAALIAAKHIEKVRINPGNYVDKKKFETIEYTDSEYNEELEKIRAKFIPLINVCKEHGTAMRIGTNHGSLSDRIMSRYGDTAIGMVESAMEFLRIAREENYHNIVLSMKSSNPIVMVDAYRTLVKTMLEEFNECYPLHLGVTEAGDGEDGRIKSAIGIGTLLEEGIGDTIRVSLTEEPEEEISVCDDLISRYPLSLIKEESNLHFKFLKNDYHDTILTKSIHNIGGNNHPVVISDLSNAEKIDYTCMRSIGYYYDANDDKWTIKDLAADYIFSEHLPEFDNFPGTLKCIIPIENCRERMNESILPCIQFKNDFSPIQTLSNNQTYVIEYNDDSSEFTNEQINFLNTRNAFIILSTESNSRVDVLKERCISLRKNGLILPIVIKISSLRNTFDKCLIDLSVESGSLFIDLNIQGVFLSLPHSVYSHLNQNNKENTTLSGRNYTQNETIESFLNSTAFSILQAVRKRITKTEYISCPSCGRTLFDLQETTAMIRQRTDHLKGVKIAIMGCIVNGPGEMADADFGYVGSGVGKITLYKGQEVVKRNIPSEVAVDELIQLLKENDAWIEPGDN